MTRATLGGLQFARDLAPAFIVLCAFFTAACDRQERASEPARSAQLPAPSAGLTSVPLTYANVVDHVAPAVVTIHSARRVKAPQQFPFFEDPLFRHFFGRNVPQNPGGSEVEHALGSGVIVRSDGHILTNQHVIDGAEEIKVDLGDKRTLSAKLVGSDPPSDLAVLKIDASNLPVLSLGDSDKVRVGDICLAVGNPLGVGQTVTAGIISAKGRSTGLSNGTFQDFLQTDAPINQGNSGGALVNTTGALIGINSQIISTTGGNIGIGFAIPSNMAKTVMDQLISHGKVSRGHLGIAVQSLTSDLASSFGLKKAEGILVSSVDPDSPAAKAGLKSGDVVTGLNGQPVNDPNTFRNMVASTAPGTDVTLTVMRNGSQQQIHVKLGTLSETQSAAAGGNGGGSSSGAHLGISVQPVTPDVASQLGLKPGTQGLVVVNVDPSGPAAEAGIQPGDVIVQVNRQPVKNLDEMRAAMGKSQNGPVLLLIKRNGQNLFIALTPRH
jgi:serine protease Do